MKQIKQTAEVNYSAIDFQDAITMLPVMDKLTEDYRRQVEYLTKESQREERRYNFNSEVEKLQQLGEQLKILAKLGFCPSVPGKLQSCEWFTF